MPASLRFEGLDQLIDELAALPQDLIHGADQDARELATAAAASLRASLPVERRAGCAPACRCAGSRPGVAGSARMSP